MVRLTGENSDHRWAARAVLESANSAAEAMTGPSEIQWTTERRELCRLLTEVHSALGGLYAYAIDLAVAPPAQGSLQARDSVIGHCLRELMNNLAAALDDVDGLPVRQRQGAAKLRKAVVERFDELPQPAFDDTDLNGVVTVTNRFGVAVRDWVDEQKRITSYVELRDSAGILGRIDPTAPALRPWREARSYFMAPTHLNVRQPPVTDGSEHDAEFSKHLENMEASLRARLGGFFSVKGEVDELLAIANQRVQDGTGE